MPIKLKKSSVGVVYSPKLGEKPPGAMYPRIIRLEHNQGSNGTLLATFECYTYETPVFPIFRSEDDGVTWELFSNVHDTKNNWGMRYQPHLFEAPQKTGTLNEGDILCAGSSIPDDMSVTQLQLYKSTDKGASWEYMSTIVTGGPAMVDSPVKDNERPVWEPYLCLSRDGDLVCHYSDERFNTSESFNQLLCLQVSKDGGLTWGPVSNTVAIPGGKLRPGMPIVVKLPNNKYIMVYEIVNIEGNPIYCKFSDDGVDWGDPAAHGDRLVTERGEFISGTPYVAWIPQGGPNGTVFASARKIDVPEGTFMDPPYYLVNYNNGEGPWEKLDMLAPYPAARGCGYSQTMITVSGGKRFLQLVSTPVNPQLCQITCAIADIIEG